MHNKLSVFIANLLIISSLTVLAFIYFPYFKLYFFNKPAFADSRASLSIYIPSINAYAPIIENVDPFNKPEYSLALTKGVAKAIGMGEVGEKGRVFLFAHSSDVPWRMTRSNTPFLFLPKVEIDDQIIINKNGTEYIYKVTKKETIDPTNLSVLKEQTEKKELVLQTCTPPGTDFKRLLVYAELVESPN